MISKQSKALPAFWRPATAFVLGCLLGSRVRVWLYRHLCKYRIDATASVGVAFVRVVDAELGQGSCIGSFSVIRNLEHLRLKPGARIGTFNWIFGMLPSDKYFVDEVDRDSALYMEEQAALTSRHIVDCTNTVHLGAFSTVAGFASQILTHGIDVATNQQTSSPVHVGEYAMVGTRVVLLKGARVPECAVIGAGSVFRGSPTESGGLWSGVPAKRVAEVDDRGEYFIRTDGHVS